MRAQRPQVVIMAAAKVGGIQANNSYPAEFMRDNLAMQTNVIDAAYRHGTRKLTVSGLKLHLPEARAAADERGLPAHRAARAHQRVVCDRQDRRA